MGGPRGVIRPGVNFAVRDSPDRASPPPGDVVPARLTSRKRVRDDGDSEAAAGETRKKKGKKDKVQVIPGGLTAEEEKDRQSKAKKAFEYFKETKIEEKKFDTYRQEREQLNYFWIVEKKRLEDEMQRLLLELIPAELHERERALQQPISLPPSRLLQATRVCGPGSTACLLYTSPSPRDRG